MASGWLVPATSALALCHKSLVTPSRVPLTQVFSFFVFGTLLLAFYFCFSSRAVVYLGLFEPPVAFKATEDAVVVRTSLWPGWFPCIW